MTGNAPTFCSDSTTYPSTVQVWWLMGCTLRQVRVLPQPVNGTKMRGSGLVTHYLPDYDHKYVDTSVRSWYNGQYTEGYLKNTFKNRYKIYKDTPDFIGSRLIGATYPGQAGQVFMGDSRDNVTNKYQGWWYGINSPNPDGSQYDADVKLMEEGWWIDERTRLVQMSCKGINANTDQSFVAIYSLEISAAGYVSPMPATIHTEIYNKDDAEDSTSINALLLFALYYLCEEITELVQGGPTNYFIDKGWLNILDVLGIMGCFGAYYSLMWNSANIPSSSSAYGVGSHRTGMYAQAQNQRMFQNWLAFACFLLCFKARKQQA